MSEKPDVLYEVAGGVATVTIDRPQVHNAFREKTMHELIDAFDRADSSEEVGVVVLTGAYETLTHMYETPELHEGTKAFLERRAPRFRR